jgi:hypothetical protein
LSFTHVIARFAPSHAHNVNFANSQKVDGGPARTRGVPKHGFLSTRVPVLIQSVMLAAYDKNDLEGLVVADIIHF